MYHFSSEVINTTCVLIINEPRLTNRQASELDSFLKKEVLMGGFTKVIVEFNQTEYIDSTVIGTLINYKRYLQQLNCEMTIVCINRMLLPTFYLSKINTVVDIFETREEAL